mgnify:CR=1 FL=1
MPSIGPVNLGIAKSTNMKVSIASSETTLLVNMDSFDSLYTKLIKFLRNWLIMKKMY